jgi:hypothetical protein
MGDVTEANSPPRLEVRIIGTAAIAQIDAIKNNKYVHRLKPLKNDVSFEYLDNAVETGQSYYYVRAEQTDGQLAWSSPVWVQYRPRRCRAKTDDAALVDGDAVGVVRPKILAPPGAARFICGLWVA